MTVIAILGALLLFTGLILKLTHRGGMPSDEAATPGQSADEPAECCGLHTVCERFAPVGDDESPYYDDEELDSFSNRDAADFSYDELDLFRNVMLTLKPDEIVPWTRALEQRSIPFPTALRDELIILLENR